MTRCTVEELQIAIPELINNNIAEIANADAKKTLESQDCHALSHAVVTLTCRRMKRDEEKRKLASLRKQKERMSRDDGEYCHAVVTQKDNCLSRGNHAIRAPKESESESESEYKKESKQKKNFSKPTVAEIAEYCKERKNNIDAERFFDYYESKGWKIGNTPMKSWQAAVRTWERNDKSEKSDGLSIGEKIERGMAV